MHMNTGEGSGVVTDGCEQPLTALCRRWELNSGPRQEL